MTLTNERVIEKAKFAIKSGSDECAAMAKQALGAEK